MDNIPHLASQMQHVLNTVPNQQAVGSGYCQRPAKKLAAAIFVQTLVFGFLATPRATLTDLCAKASQLGVSISEAGLHLRFVSAAAKQLLLMVCQAALCAMVHTDPSRLDILARFNGVYVLDSTTVMLPTALAAEWPGCGSGQPKVANAGLKVQVCLDLSSGALSGELHRASLPDQASQTAHHLLPVGSLRVADLGYFSLSDFALIAAAGSYYLSRLRAKIKVYDHAGQLLDLFAVLPQLEGEQRELAVRLGQREQLPTRLLSERVPEAVAALRRRRLNQQAQRHGRQPSAVRCRMADWNLYITNAGPDQLDYAAAHTLYRARWQIERLFCLWKEQGRLDQCDSADLNRIVTELYAKLTALIVQHWLVLVSCWADAERSVWKASKLVSEYARSLLKALQQASSLISELEQMVVELDRVARISKSQADPRTAQLLIGYGRVNLIRMGARTSYPWPPAV